MAKTIEGYIREHPNGQPLASVDVAILDDVTGSVIPPGGMWKADGNPMVTDSNGFFSWNCELSPGPLRVEGNVNAGSELKVRSGREVMQAGDVFISDLPEFLRLFTTGVFQGVASAFRVDAIVGQRAVRVLPGSANMLGRYFSTLTNREITLAENTTLTTRKDLVVLEQYVAGDYQGRQNIAIIQGTVNNTVPASNLDPDILQLPIATVSVAMSATTVTVEDTRVYSGPSSLGVGTITLENLSSEVLDYIAAQFPGFTVKSGSSTIKTTTKTITVKDGLKAVAGTGNEVIITLDSVAAVGKQFKDVNFAAFGSDGSERTLASTTVTLAPGTWLIQTMLTVSGRALGNEGYTRLKLTGTGTPEGSDVSTRAYHTYASSRQMVLTGRKIVSPTTTTTYTINARTVHEDLDTVYIEDGNLHVVVV
jgi:hypothetical protein